MIDLDYVDDKGRVLDPKNLDFDPHDPEQLVAAFKALYPFPLDDFQQAAISYLATGDSVMVAAPTGTGKTVVAEFGVFRAFVRGWRVMYTTPIKALSNQKFRDLREQYGDAVGLLTGDIIENREGAILVMTTEVLRNMLLQTPSELWGVGCIVFDEIHYLADEERGTTWEEAIIMCPKDIQLACLSATVSNAGEIAEWITRTHRPLHLVTHYQRAVPLSYYYYLDGALNLVIDANGKQVSSFDNVGGEMRRHMRTPRVGPRGGEDDVPAARERPEPTPREIVTALEEREMLPAIFFLFSRRDCEAAAEVCAMMRLRAVRDQETRLRIEDILAKYMNRLSSEDRELEQVKTIVYLVRRGFGFHHAGLLPILKQLVEEVFSQSLMRVVFATDTLALGINMPARSVVIGRMNKWDGVQRRPLIPNEFQQMAGRAGRRGIDPQGYVVIPYSPWVTFNEALSIATGPLRPVESAFTIRYNTVLNLWNPPDGDRVLDVMRHSLLQFQQSRRLYDLEEAVEEREREIEEIPSGCLIGLPEGEDLLDEYEALGRALETARDRERKLGRTRVFLESSRTELPWRRPERDVVRRILRAAQPGILVHIERQGWAVYLTPGTSGAGLFWLGDRVIQIDQYSNIDYIPPDRPMVQLPDELADIAAHGARGASVVQVGHESREWLQQQLAQIDLPDLDQWIAEHRQQQGSNIDDQLAQLDRQIEEAHEYTTRLAAEERAHACHTCPVRKQHRSNRRLRARAEAALNEAMQVLESRRQYEENRLTALLDGMINVLRKFYYLDREGNLTAKAARLIDIFDTNALMISELIESGYLNGLQPADLGEVFSWFAYDRDVEFRNRHLLPGHLVRLRDRLDDLQRDVFQTERRYELLISTGYNPYFYGAARAWCRGATMAELLGKMDLSEGDLVSTFNKVIDLMRQVREMLARGGARRVVPAGETPDELTALHDSLQEAEKMIRRGVVEMIYNIGFVEQQPAGIDGARQDIGDLDANGEFGDRPPSVSTGFEDVDRMLGLLDNPQGVIPPVPVREEGLQRVNRPRRDEPRPRRTNNRPGPQSPDNNQGGDRGPAHRSRPPNRRPPRR